MEPLIITVAPVGAELMPEQTPHLAVKPEQLGDVAAKCREAGASIIHVHCRNDDGSNTHDVARFKQAYDEIRARSDLIVQFSTGGAIGMSPEERAGVLVLHPEMAMRTLRARETPGRMPTPTPTAKTSNPRERATTRILRKFKWAWGSGNSLSFM
jgi:uncharacterized protein (DUF849 family)